MKNVQILLDKTAIGLSLLCTIHCLVLPLFIVSLPSFAALLLNDEALHIWMVLAVIPTSAYALIMGCKQHKRYRLLITGLVGLLVLIVSAVFGETLLSESGEKMLVLLGAGIIAYGHYKNYHLCQHQGNCTCPESCDESSK